MNSNQALSAKKAMRLEMRSRLLILNPGIRALESAAVSALIEGMGAWCRARTVGLFVPMADEIGLEDLLASAWAAGKIAAIPGWREELGEYQFLCVSSRDDLVTGRFGIREPAPDCREVSAAWLDFVVVPGLAFDRSGRRLGRGKGFYDRLLTGVTGVTCGVGFECQLVAVVPVEPHDVTVKLVAMPQGLLSPATGP